MARDISTSIKEWLHPGLMYLLGMIVCYEVSTIQSDVKTLLAQSNIDKTEIIQLKQDVADLKQAVFFNKHAALNERIDAEIVSATRVQYNPVFFKHEEEFDIKKFIPRRI